MEYLNNNDRKKQIKDTTQKLTVSKELEGFEKKEEETYEQLENFQFEYTNQIKNSDFLYN